MAKWFLKNHDFIHVNSSVAGKCNKHKQDGSHLRFPIRMILATVDLQVTSILPMNFESIALYGSGEKVQNSLSRWTPWLQFGISYCNDLSYFLYTTHPDASRFESIGLSVQKKKGKIDFQDGHHLGFLIGTILANFISTSHPNAPYQFSNQLALWFRKISEKKSFKMAAILDFRSKQVKLFYIYKSPQCFLSSFESNGQEKKRK